MTRFALVAATVAITLMPGGAGVRVSAADQLRRLPPGAALLGQVIDAGSGRGLDRAVVSIASATLRRSAVVDQRGRFLFSGLPAGEYVITASRSGYLNGAFGQRRAGGTFVPLRVTDGQWLGTLDIPLWRPGVVTGDVRDHTGDPVEGLIVTAYRREEHITHTRLTAAARATTDDTGSYRLTPLTPGDYVVGVGTDADALFTPEYYPDTSTPSMASPVTVSPGREFTGINFTMPVQDGREVSGRVERSALPEARWPLLRVAVGRAIDGSTIEHVGQRLLAETTVDDDGKFVFPRVPPGEWVLETYLAEGPPVEAGADATTPLEGPARVWASVPIVVGDAPLRDVQVNLQPALSIRGRARLVSANRQARVPAGLSVTFVPVFQQAGHERLTARVNPDGAFATAEALLPQRYLLEVGGLPNGWRLAGIQADGLDVSDLPLDLTSGRVPLDVVVDVTDQLAVLAGTVRGADALGDATATVLVFPRDERLSGERRFRAVRAGLDGAFVIRDLPPGDYHLIAVDDAETSDWVNADRLDRYRPRATSITLRAGETRFAELRRAPAR